MKKIFSLIALLVSTSATFAGTVTQTQIAGSNGLNNLGSYTGSVKYDTNDGATGLLDITLKNTSSVALDGEITAFVFNINGNASATYQPIGGDTFSNITGDKLKASPFGTFEAGAGIGGQFQGGGSPNSGINPGDQRTFRFNVTGTATNSLSALDFLTEQSTGTGAGEGYQAFVVRFRGFTPDGSDKVPTTSIPSPAALGAGLALLGVLSLKRRQN